MSQPLSESNTGASRQRTRFFESVWKTVIVVGTSLIIFAAARNTVTWHVQQIWGASHDFWQSQWGSICDLFNDNFFYMASVGSFVVTMFVFWVANLILLYIDTRPTPTALHRYKVQPDQNTPIDYQKLRSAILRVIFNQTVVAGPFFFIIPYVYEWRGCTASRELPYFHWVLFEIFCFTIVEEIGFYYSHRLLHHPRLYRHIHKIHHEWTAPIGIISLYAHPFEHMVSNLLPPFVGPLILGSHLATAWLWFCLALLSTTVAHSGYHLPFLPSPEAHDFHHLKFTNNFGVLGVLDRLHGTDTMFRNSKAYDRHILLLSLVPIREVYPESVKDKSN